jgi:hypothetical protein
MRRGRSRSLIPLSLEGGHVGGRQLEHITVYEAAMPASLNARWIVCPD